MFVERQQQLSKINIDSWYTKVGAKGISENVIRYCYCSRLLHVTTYRRRHYFKRKESSKRKSPIKANK